MVAPPGQKSFCFRVNQRGKAQENMGKLQLIGNADFVKSTIRSPIYCIPNENEPYKSTEKKP